MRLRTVGSVEATQCDSQTTQTYAQTWKDQYEIKKKHINPPTNAKEKWCTVRLNLTYSLVHTIQTILNSYDRFAANSGIVKRSDPVAIEAHATLNQVIMKGTTEPTAEITDNDVRYRTAKTYYY